MLVTGEANINLKMLWRRRDHRAQLAATAAEITAAEPAISATLPVSLALRA